MPLYYDEDGDVSFTRDEERAQRNHVQTMLTATRYRLVPDAAPALTDMLGPAPSPEEARQAKRRIRRALNAIGLGDVNVDSMLEVVDEEFELKAEIGQQAST